MTKKPILWANEPLPVGLKEKDVERLHHPAGPKGSNLRSMTRDEHERQHRV